ncbi:hypothetical protein RFN58_35315 [Streptomyces iakyrus]|uniref:hypothetical protein n=1 Tax=Streptomyces iakyrus TaxID=68219 RepID=UPI0005264FD3|nr:hypothetical protein [Streptomyces iakyrus]
MRQPSSNARPAARRGLGAAVLLALLALLHASFSPGTVHVSALDLDGCLQRHLAATAAQPCDAAPVAALTAVGADGHHDGDAAQSCDASAYGPRQVADLSNDLAATDAAPGTGAARSAFGAVSGVASSVAPGTPSGSLVLRC